MRAEEVVRHLLEDENGAGPVRESLRWLVQQLMQAEVSELIGAAHGERSEDRATWRNGYRPAQVGHTRRRARAAHLEAAPRQLLPLLPRAPLALGAGAAGGRPAGLRVRRHSTRRVDQLVESLGLLVGRSEVSCICAQLDEQVEAFRQRPLKGDYSLPVAGRQAREGQRRWPGRLEGSGDRLRRARDTLGFDVGAAETEGVLE
jgi:putative transposase